MMLFSRAAGGNESAFRRALHRFCACRLDELTLALLEQGTG